MGFPRGCLVVGDCKVMVELFDEAIVGVKNGEELESFAEDYSCEGEEEACCKND